MLERWLQRLHRAEDALLAGLLVALLLLAVGQILLRLLFDGGLEWAEPVSRTGVLWLAMLGALGATRSRKHIAIDALPRLLRGGARRAAWSLSQLAAAGVCAAMAWFGAGMIALEREAPVPFVAGVPSWVPMLVIPAGFGLMALRFVLAGLAPPPVDAEAGEGMA
jgi:TRAP-type C4-dicarboxylate transport system permease small subunit